MLAIKVFCFIKLIAGLAYDQFDFDKCVIHGAGVV
jgi:hypothetical protein